MSAVNVGNLITVKLSCALMRDFTQEKGLISTVNVQKVLDVRTCTVFFFHVNYSREFCEALSESNLIQPSINSKEVPMITFHM